MGFFLLAGLAAVTGLRIGISIGRAIRRYLDSNDTDSDYVPPYPNGKIELPFNSFPSFNNIPPYPNGKINLPNFSSSSDEEDVPTYPNGKISLTDFSYLNNQSSRNRSSTNLNNFPLFGMVDPTCSKCGRHFWSFDPSDDICSNCKD